MESEKVVPPEPAKNVVEVAPVAGSVKTAILRQAAGERKPFITA